MSDRYSTDESEARMLWLTLLLHTVAVGVVGTTMSGGTPLDIILGQLRIECQSRSVAMETRRDGVQQQNEYLSGFGHCDDGTNSVERTRTLSEYIFQAIRSVLSTFCLRRT